MENLSLIKCKVFFLIEFIYYFKWHLNNTLNERALTSALKITILNFRQISSKMYKLTFLFSKDTTMINPLIHGGNKGHTFLKKAAAKN